jgi:hypothetical protein
VIDIRKFPDKLLISKIKNQHVYFDFKSIEKTTKIQKRKYKLAGNTINLSPYSFYPFFLITKNQDACRKCLTVCIEQVDWEQKVQGYLNLQYSYIDIHKVEVLNENDILDKIKDSQNGFPCVAKLSDKKYEELKSKLLVLSSNRDIVSQTTSIIQCALAEANIAETILEKLKLN